MTHSSKLRYDVATAIHPGARERQEDCLVSDFAQGAPLGIAVLADGMGGHNAGEVASALVVSDIFAELKMSQATLAKKPGKIPERLRDAVEAANERLLQMMRTKPDLRGMGSTVVAAVVMNDALYWASVGDSPLYLFRDGQLMRLNQDHSMAPRIDAMVAAGQISAEVGAGHPDRNCLTSAITGKDIPRIDCPNVPFGVEDGDVVLIASDGLQSLTDAEIAETLSDTLGATGMAISDALIAAVAAKQKSNQDNISATVMAVRSAASVAAAPPRTSIPPAKRPEADPVLVAINSSDIEEASDLLNQAIAL